ncbi:ankyrin repeat and zinc finger domain-containing protein 1 [Tanacetum coccineum]
MESTSGHRTTVVNSGEQNKPKRRKYSIFEIKSSFSCLTELLSTPKLTTNAAAPSKTAVEESSAAEEESNVGCSERWACNTCELSFECLHDQRSHFKSDFHRFSKQ